MTPLQARDIMVVFNIILIEKEILIYMYKMIYPTV